MVNLLQETIDTLKQHNKEQSDVLWVDDGLDNYMLWSEFKKLSDIKYDCSYGGQEINPHLKVIGKDFWLERHEYDGSEWWEFKSKPKKPKNHSKIEIIQIY